MRNKLFFAFVVVIIVVISCTKTTPPPVTKTDTLTIVKKDTVTITKIDTLRWTDSTLKLGLLVYLPFNGSIADSSGNANPTNAVGGASLTYDEHGKANSAFGGTGNGERVIVTNNGSIKFDTAFSFSINVTLNNTNVRTLASMTQASNGHGVSFALGTGLAGFQNITFSVVNSSFTCNDELLNSNTLNDTTNLNCLPQAWYNIIGIYHRGTVQVYSNGILIDSKTGGTNTVPICPAAQLIIGGWWDGDTQSVDGKLDEVRLYNRVLSPFEIARLSRKF